MFVLRRIWKCKPGEARRVASLLQTRAQMYHDAGLRNEFRVYFNGYTTPSEPATVVMEWTDAALMPPSRPGNHLPLSAAPIRSQVNKLTESNRLEIMELMTPEKMLDV
jgi:hypothetical protein